MTRRDSEPDTGMHTGSSDPRDQPPEEEPALDRDELAIAGELAAPGPREREPAVEDREAMTRAAKDDATLHDDEEPE